jgi:hypothetical protein
MATPAEHRSKALKNERLIQTYRLAESEFVEWAVSVLFYAALHWMRALSAQEGFEIRGYTKGLDSERVALQRVPIFMQAGQEFGWYRTLKDKSQDARYEMKSYSATDFRDLQRNYYDPFKHFILSPLHP